MLCLRAALSVACQKPVIPKMKPIWPKSNTTYYTKYILVQQKYLHSSSLSKQKFSCRSNSKVSNHRKFRINPSKEYSLIHDTTNKLFKIFGKMNRLSQRITIIPNHPVTTNFKRSTEEFLFAESIHDNLCDFKIGRPPYLPDLREGAYLFGG